MATISQNKELDDMPQILWQSGSGVSLKAFSGEGARPYLNQIAALRIDLYKEFPYLYEGSLDYEKKYLDTYFNSKDSRILLVFDLEKVVGFSNSIPLTQESDWIIKPFEKFGLNLSDYYYMGEVTLKAPYRRKGLLRRFFEAHESEAKLKGLSKLVFMTVKRDPALFPPNHTLHDGMWHHFGYEALSGFDIVFLWNQIDTNKEEHNRMQVWSKTL